MATEKVAQAQAVAKRSRKGTVIADMKKLKPDELRLIVSGVLDAVSALIVGQANWHLRLRLLDDIDFSHIQQGCGPGTRHNRLSRAVRRAIIRSRNGEGRFVTPVRPSPPPTFSSPPQLRLVHSRDAATGAGE